MLNKLNYSFFISIVLAYVTNLFADNALIFQSDFGLKDGAVSAMKGVAYGVDHQLKMFDLTHDIPAFNIWEAAYRLDQTAPYWPPGTVFVSVVDPGVGTSRKSVVLKTKNGQYFIAPDNGTLGLVADKFGIEAVREINESINRLPGSNDSYTFHGRDVYAYTGARLASGVINFTEVGPELAKQVLRIPYQVAKVTNGELSGNLPILDPQYGNAWSNIPKVMLQQIKVKMGDILCVSISNGDLLKYQGKARYVHSFGAVAPGMPLIYVNSLMNVAIALNMADFSAKYQIKSGPEWAIRLRKCK